MTDADIDALFTSGYTLATTTVTAPCDFYDADAAQQGEEGVGGFVLRRKTALVRASAFPDLGSNEPLTLTGPDSIPGDYIVQGEPLRVQDGSVLEVTLQEAAG